jgi:(p)ppGpp synthase/HD superfamily hydrolase
MRQPAIIEKAREFAFERHAGQFRKYTGEPYFTHCENVANMVIRKAQKEDCVEVGLVGLVAAAYLHDVLEDTDTDREELNHYFGEAITKIVHELTDFYTPENFPFMNREERKWHEANRLHVAQAYVAGVKVIKWCDLIDNTNSIVEHDPKFAIVYLREKAQVLEQLGFGK